MVSVIIPNYNHSKFLKQRIDSVLNQTYQDFEIIILDDSSTDCSYNIINEYQKNAKVSHCVINKVNSGNLFKQWVKGVSLAKGELIWIAESDDYSDICFLEKMVNKFDEKTVFVYCRSVVVDDDNKIMGDGQKWLEDLSQYELNRSFSTNGINLFCKYAAYKNIVLNSSAVVFKKELFLKIKEKITQFKYSGDWMCFSLLLLYGDVKFINEPLNYWRQHSETTRNVKDFSYDLNRIKENIEIINYFIYLLKRNNCKINYSNYSWVIKWWISRFTYKNLLKKEYLLLPFPYPLNMKFYYLLLIRFLKESIKSVRKKIL